MSTIAYAWATSRAEQNALLAKVTDADEQPDTSKASELAQKIAALVPAEVIAAWAAVLATELLGGRHSPQAPEHPS